MKESAIQLTSEESELLMNVVLSERYRHYVTDKDKDILRVIQKKILNIQYYWKARASAKAYYAGREH